MAVWDAREELRCPVVPASRGPVLRWPSGGKHFFVYSACGYYYPGKDLNGLLDEWPVYL